MFPLEPHSIVTLIGCGLYLVSRHASPCANSATGARPAPCCWRIWGWLSPPACWSCSSTRRRSDHELVYRINHYWLVLSIFLYHGAHLEDAAIQTTPAGSACCGWPGWSFLSWWISTCWVISESTYRALNFSQPSFTGACLAVGWLGFTWYLFYLALKALRKPYEPITRNRGYYWVLALIFIASSDFLFLFDFLTLGHILRWPGVLFTAAVVHPRVHAGYPRGGAHCPELPGDDHPDRHVC